MDRQQAKEYVKKNPQLHLKRDKTRKGYICPLCGSGSGKKGTGLSTKDGIHYTCWACSQIVNMDMIDIIGAEYGITDSKEKFNKAYEIYGINNIESAVVPCKLVERAESVPSLPEEDYDFTEIIEKAHRHLMVTPHALAYIKGRGIPEELIVKYKLGYTESYNYLLWAYPHLKTRSKKQKYYKYIQPNFEEGICNYFYAEISNRKQMDEYNGKYRKLKNVHQRLFNEHYIKEANPPRIIFVCEGVYDALSIEAVGGHAIAFVGTADKRFLELCELYRPRVKIIIMLDNDGAGQAAVERVKEGLNKLHIINEVVFPIGGKDANEALQNNPKDFKMDMQRYLS